ncbi:MAG: site-specific integrase [Betaproteobacteria bacterium HGW-Betaproteobacteria-6]|jgi:integrase|nr:MAG: site-specific integrase [Betaproteobacteria bacterium HGW-Betaproteobacteria-6]
MGSIRQRSDTGLLFVDFRYQGQRCREQTALTDTPANRKRLGKVLSKIEEEISTGTFNYRQFFPSSKNAAKFDQLAPEVSLTGAAQAVAGVGMAVVKPTPLFKDFADIWYGEKEIEWRGSHKKTVRDDIDKRLVPQFGEKEVGSITKADILAFRADLAKAQARGKKQTLSNPRINKILNPLRQILCEAADRFDFRTPFQNIKQLKVKRTDVDPFSLEEVRKIIDTVRIDFKQYFTVRFFTGMRTGEVHGLKWKYVDFERRLLMVRETIVDGEEGETKNDSSQRDIQMSQMVFDALKIQEAGTRKISEYVFCNSEGRPLDYKNVTNRVWRPLLRHLGLKVRRPYQCRHTAATLWLGAGENPEWIARQLGHTTTEMLFRVYSRYVPNLTRRDGSAFDRLLTATLGGGNPVLASKATTITQPSERSSV